MQRNNALISGLVLAASMVAVLTTPATASTPVPGIQSETTPYQLVQYGGWRGERDYSYRRYCARLRRACMYKEERGQVGEGNCRRYRQECGRY